MTTERRASPRKKFSYYMKVLDSNTRELVGYLSDISEKGFKLDTKQSLALNKDYNLRMDLTSEISNRPNISFTARALWCLPDPLAPYEFVVGFKIVNIPQGELEIYNRIMEKYATPAGVW